MPDGSIWEISAEVIAQHRAAAFADQFDDDVEASLQLDTLPTFQADPSEIIRWARNEMDWADVALFAQKVDQKPMDLEEGWFESTKELI